MNVHQSIEYMDFTMNAKEDILLVYGKDLQTVSIVYLLLPLLQIKYFACKIIIYLFFKKHKKEMKIKNEKIKI